MPSPVQLLNESARAVRKLLFEQLKLLRRHSPVIVAEGDSWFQHPLANDVIDELYDRPYAYNIRCLCAAGDELSAILQKAEFVAAIRQEHPAAFLFSGGGNDVVAGSMLKFLKESAGATKASDCIDKPALDAEMTRLAGLYRQVHALVQQTQPGLPMVVHGYAHPVPGRKYLGFIDWGLGDNMEARHVPKSLRKEVAALMIDAFYKMLRGLKSQLAGLHVADLRPAVGPADFMDELHLDTRGAIKIAKVLDVVLQKAIGRKHDAKGRWT